MAQESEIAELPAKLDFETLKTNGEVGKDKKGKYFITLVYFLDGYFSLESNHSGIESSELEKMNRRKAPLSS